MRASRTRAGGRWLHEQAEEALPLPEPRIAQPEPTQAQAVAPLAEWLSGETLAALYRLRERLPKRREAA